MKSIIFAVIIFTLFLTPAFGRQNDKTFIKEAKNSKVIILAELVERPSHTVFWSGLFASFQNAEYKVLEVIKGEIKSQIINVGHPIVKGSFTVDKNEPKLSTQLFKKGNHLILLLTRESYSGCKLETNNSNIETFCTIGENYGARLSNPELLEKLKQDIKN
jgi:hypothetical protein